MIGYLIEQELGNLLPFEKPFATVLTMVEVDPDDPAFDDPTKFIGPVYERAEAERLAAEKGWAIKPDGDKWRRVVRLAAAQAHLRDPADQVAAREGRRRDLHRRRRHPDDVRARHQDARRRRGRHRQGPRVGAAGARARGRPVRDGDRRRRRLPRLGHAARSAASSRRRPSELARHRTSPPGSMGPKVEAAVEFAERTGKRAAIGTLAEIGGVVAGTHGTSRRPWLTLTSIDRRPTARAQTGADASRESLLVDRHPHRADHRRRSCCSAPMRPAARCRSRCSWRSRSPGCMALAAGPSSGAPIRDAAIGGVSSAMGAVYILLAVGALIGTWNMAGTIPTIVYYGIALLQPSVFYLSRAGHLRARRAGDRQLVDDRGDARRRARRAGAGAGRVDR